MSSISRILSFFQAQENQFEWLQPTTTPMLNKYVPIPQMNRTPLLNEGPMLPMRRDPVRGRWSRPASPGWTQRRPTPSVGPSFLAGGNFSTDKSWPDEFLWWKYWGYSLKMRGVVWAIVGATGKGGLESKKIHTFKKMKKNSP